MAWSWIVAALIVVVVVVFAALARRSRGVGAGLEPNALRDLIEDDHNEHLVIDVRSPGEYRAGHIPTAINIPHAQIGEQPPEVPKERLIVLYCQSGARSRNASHRLAALGFSRVVNFGAIGRWSGPVVRGERPGKLAGG